MSDSKLFQLHFIKGWPPFREHQGYVNQDEPILVYVSLTEFVRRVYNGKMNDNTSDMLSFDFSSAFVTHLNQNLSGMDILDKATLPPTQKLVTLPRLRPISHMYARRGR